MTASPTTEQMVEGGLRSSLLGIGINLALAMVKCVTGLIGHSFALLADGIESFLDVISSSVVYWGLRLAIKPPDKDHPYGHGKADPIAAASRRRRHDRRRHRHCRGKHRPDSHPA